MALSYQMQLKDTAHSVWWAVSMVSLVAIGAYGCGQSRTDESPSRSEGQRVAADNDIPVRLAISVVKPEDRPVLSIRVEVTNVSNRPIGWDREFSIFLIWVVKLDRNDEREDAVVLRRLERSEVIGRGRFMFIEPGNTLTKVICLTDPFRQFGYDEQFSPGVKDATGFVGYERMVRYSIPRTAAKAQVRLEYIGNWAAPVAFRDLFGFDARDVALWHGQSESNDVEIRFP